MPERQFHEIPSPSSRQLAFDIRGIGLANHRAKGTRRFCRIILQGKSKMPEISRFFGIVIFMYFDEHNPPHFHARYNEDRAVISINELKVLDGRLPKRALSLVLEWANEHREELMSNWNSLRTTGEYAKIAPLE